MDPTLSLVGRLALAILFASAAYHKARDLPRFEAILTDYRILPSRLVPVTTRLVIGVEFGVTIGLLVPSASFAAFASLAPLGAAALLTLYSLAIAINLARGRREIDCGCGVKADQTLRPGLLARNGLLISIALASALPVTGRDLSLLDGMTLVFGLAVLALIWRAGGQLASFPLPVPMWPRPTPRRRTAR